MACGVQLKRKEKAEVREELMIKKRLVGLLSHAKKYIIYQVVWQWLALLCQVVMIHSASMLLETALFREVTPRAAAGYGVLVLVALILRFVCDRQASHVSYRASVDVKRILRDKIYSKLLRLGAAHRTGEAAPSGDDPCYRARNGHAYSAWDGHGTGDSVHRTDGDGSDAGDSPLRRTIL